MQKKIIWKLNIVDLLLIVILGLSVLGLVYKFTFGQTEENLQAFTFTYVCEESPLEVLRSAEEGEGCADGDYGTSLGSLQSAQIEALADRPDAGRAVFVTQVDGEKAEHGVTVGDVLYLKGKRFNLMIGDAMFNVYISDIQEGAQDAQT